MASALVGETTVPVVSQPDSAIPSIRQSHPVQVEALRLFSEIRLKDERLQLPAELAQVAHSLPMAPTATPSPVLPCPLKMAESCGARWALHCVVSNLICRRRYAIDQSATVNTDIVVLFLMSSALVKVDGKPTARPRPGKRDMKYDLGNSRQVYQRLCHKCLPDERQAVVPPAGLDEGHATQTRTMLHLPVDQPKMEEDKAMAFACNRRPAMGQQNPRRRSRYQVSPSRDHLPDARRVRRRRAWSRHLQRRAISSSTATGRACLSESASAPTLCAPPPRRPEDGVSGILALVLYIHLI